MKMIKNNMSIQRIENKNQNKFYNQKHKNVFNYNKSINI